jgi:hypothetical protein
MSFPSSSNLLSNSSSRRSGYGAVPTADTASSPTGATYQPRTPGFETPSCLARRNEPPAPDTGTSLQYQAVPRQAPPQLDEMKDPGFTPYRQKLAGYMLALDAMNYPYTEETRDLLRDMTDVKSATMAMFPYGDPNNLADLIRTGGQNRVRLRLVESAVDKFFGEKLFSDYCTNNKHLLHVKDDNGEMVPAENPSRAERLGIFAHFGVMPTCLWSRRFCWGTYVSHLRLQPALAHQFIKNGFDHPIRENENALIVETPGADLRNPRNRLTLPDAGDVCITDSTDSAILREHSRVPESGIRKNRESSQIYEEMKMDEIGFLHGMQLAKSKIEAIFLKECKPQKLIKLKAEVEREIDDLKRHDGIYYSQVNPGSSMFGAERHDGTNHSQINPRFAICAAEAITALADGQAIQMATNIAKYLGASPEEAVAKAPEVVARAMQLRTYEEPLAAGPA